ncbi:MAG: DNA mismatch repair protein MutS, partial [Gammaproteobacteria bacterium]
SLETEISRLQPAELIYCEDQILPLDGSFNDRSHSMPPWYFEQDTCRRLLCEQYQTLDLQGFGIADLPLAIGAAGCLLQYVKETLRTEVPHLQPIHHERIEDVLLIDASSRRNLELTESNNPQIGGHNLLSTINNCTTSMGFRELSRWIQKPLRNQTKIRERHHAVASLLHNRHFEDLAEWFSEVGDIERILARIALLSARPRDLTTLRATLALIPAIRTVIDALESPLIEQLSTLIGNHPEVSSLLENAVVDEPPLLIRDGGVIKTGFDEELDELRGLSSNADQFLLELEQREQARTGINTLKVAYNRIHGFYIEVGKSHIESIPADFIRRQTLKAVERYITPELKSFEDKVLSARERSLSREKHLYENLLKQLVDSLKPLQQSAIALAQLDVLNSFAILANYKQWSQPELVDERVIDIKDGRHPVVEEVMQEPFIANNTLLDANSSMLLVTGPNMGGKSTYMRQTALIVILAYMGCYVPASSARIGPIDQIFTRIGASDDLSSGRSTFMVEMTEAANILNNATPNSLVLMDEIGRGTSTFDGLALAWACADHLAVKTRSLTLFATHYFELTVLPEQFSNVDNLHLDAVEHGDNIIFMHQVKPGPANQSYGIQVAKLAGIPASAISLAKKKLKWLEQQSDRKGPQVDLFDQLTLEPEIEDRSELVDALTEIEPDNLSPREALDILYQLKRYL